MNSRGRFLLFPYCIPLESSETFRMHNIKAGIVMISTISALLVKKYALGGFF